MLTEGRAARDDLGTQAAPSKKNFAMKQLMEKTLIGAAWRNQRGSAMFCSNLLFMLQPLVGALDHEACVFYISWASVWKVLGLCLSCPFWPCALLLALCSFIGAVPFTVALPPYFLLASIPRYFFISPPNPKPCSKCKKQVRLWHAASTHYMNKTVDCFGVWTSKWFRSPA